MKEFDWDEFKKGNITIHCKTKSEANDFCRLANTRGLRCNFSRGTEFWEKYNLSKYYWKERTLWTDGYFICSIGNVSSETLKNYILNQG